MRESPTQDEGDTYFLLFLFLLPTKNWYLSHAYAVVCEIRRLNEGVTYFDRGIHLFYIAVLLAELVFFNLARFTLFCFRLLSADLTLNSPATTRLSRASGYSFPNM